MYGLMHTSLWCKHDVYLIMALIIKLNHEMEVLRGAEFMYEETLSSTKTTFCFLESKQTAQTMIRSFAGLNINLK